MGGQNTCLTNPRWRMAAILKIDNHDISTAVWLML